MCGRFTRKYTWQELIALYRLTLGTSNLEPRYNICPTTTIDTVVSADGKRELASMRWGLIPSWWNKSLKKMNLATFNARVENVEQKPMFRARLSNVTAASSPHRAITNGRARQPESSSIISRPRMVQSCRLPAYGTNGKTKTLANCSSPAR